MRRLRPNERTAKELMDLFLALTSAFDFSIEISSQGQLNLVVSWSHSLVCYLVVSSFWIVSLFFMV